MKKVRLSNHTLKKQLNDLENIENLLEESKVQYKSHNVQINPVQYSLDGTNINQIKLTNHCYRRAKERFKMGKNEADAYFKSVLLKARKIGLTKAEDGSQAYLYAHGRIGMYVSTDYREIKTVIKQESVTYEPLKDKVAELHAKEIRKITRKESAHKRRLQDAILEVNLEIAGLELRKHKTRSIAVKNACEARIGALRLYIEEMKSELDDIQTVKRQISRSMVSVV